jgi:hypothetical protein
MKATMWGVLALLVALALPSASAVAVEKDRTAGDRTITKVVELLQKMMDKSVKEGDEEREIYAKFKCYCDTNEAEKKASVESLTEQIALLESKIAEIQGDTGTLSSECAELKTKMAENKAAQKDATSVREKENKAFKAEEADLEKAIEDMKKALKVLGEVGADQTSSDGAADNKKFMAGFKGAFFATRPRHTEDCPSFSLRSHDFGAAQDGCRVPAGTVHRNLHLPVGTSLGHHQEHAGPIHQRPRGCQKARKELAGVL